MRALARDSVALEHLVFAQPIAVGAEDYEVSCSEDEQVVMCPAWAIGGTFGPGRHRWRSPEPQFPATAYFVRTKPVQVAFAMSTTFAHPSSHQSVHLRASGSLQAQCRDAGLLIAQLVGLPSEALNDEIIRSISRSVERRVARLLARRVIAMGIAAVNDPAELPAVLAELAGYDLAEGAVSGIDVVQVDELVVAADGAMPKVASQAPLAFSFRTERLPVAVTSDQSLSACGEIVVQPTVASDPITSPGIGPVGRARNSILDIGNSHIGARPSEPALPHAAAEVATPVDEPSPEHVAYHSSGLSPGTRVLVPSPTGLMQSATVRQLQRGHYELEVGGSGETIWVPVSGVVPE